MTEALIFIAVLLILAIQASIFPIFEACIITKGPGRSRASRGLKFGECKGAIFAPNDRTLNASYEAFATVFTSLSASSWAFDQEVLENKGALTAVQRTTTSYARYLAISFRLRRAFDPDDFILCPAVGAIEPDG
jgi:hypothetical protein